MYISPTVPGVPQPSFLLLSRPRRLRPAAITSRGGIPRPPLALPPHLHLLRHPHRAVPLRAVALHVISLLNPQRAPPCRRPAHLCIKRLPLSRVIWNLKLHGNNGEQKHQCFLKYSSIAFGKYIVCFVLLLIDSRSRW
jgi:hypothetical protein